MSTSQPSPGAKWAFWVFYLLIGVWLDIVVTDLWWGMGVGASLAFPVLVMQRTGILNAQLVVATDFGNPWVQLLVTAIVSFVGVLLLASAGVYWVRLHRWMFRRFGGMNL